MLHPILTALALACLAGAGILGLVGAAWHPLALVAAGLFGALATERAVAGVRAFLRFRVPGALLFPVLHLIQRCGLGLRHRCLGDAPHVGSPNPAG